MKIYSIFKRWLSGSHCEHLDPIPPAPNEAKPFHVCIRSNGWIPISSLVFARNEEHALERVKTALREMLETGGYDSEYSSSKRNATRILEGIEDGSFDVHVALADIASLAYTVNWAGNGGI